MKEYCFDFTGKLDDYVVCSWKGRKYLRRRPRSTAGFPTPGMAAQQERMASVAVFYQALKEVGIYPFWQRAVRRKRTNGYALLTRENLPAFRGDGAIGDFAKLRPTPDLLPLPDGLTLGGGADGTWTLAWEADSGLPGAAADDALRLLAMRDAETFVFRPVDTGGALRGDGAARFSLPEDARDCVHLFVYFCSRTDEVCTSSRYFNLNSLTFNQFNYGYI